MEEDKKTEETDTPKTNQIIDTKSTIKRGRKPLSERSDYICQKTFTEAMLQYYRDGTGERYIFECLDKIANGLSKARSFNEYTWKEDMIGDAKIKMYKAFLEKKYKHKERSVDPDTGEVIEARNPFSYFNRIAHRAFIARIKRENKTAEAHAKYRDHYYDEFMTEQLDETFQSKKTPYNNEE